MNYVKNVLFATLILFRLNYVLLGADYSPIPTQTPPFSPIVSPSLENRTRVVNMFIVQEQEKKRNEIAAFDRYKQTCYGLLLLVVLGLGVHVITAESICKPADRKGRVFDDQIFSCCPAESSIGCYKRIKLEEYDAFKRDVNAFIKKK